MSWLSTLRTATSTVFDVGKALLGSAARGASAVIAEAKRFVDQTWKIFRKALRSDPQTESERLERELQEVNERAIALRKRWKERGQLLSEEQRQWDQLKARRKDIGDRLRGLEQGCNAEEIVKRENDYKPVKITDETSHVLQYHVGQSTFEKTCSCGRNMVLQWARTNPTPNLKDFFWGCAGWYVQNNDRRLCQRTELLGESDLDLFANLSRPEFALPASELTRQVTGETREVRVRAALESIRSTHRSRRIGIRIYRCPLHGESLVLKKKREAAADLFDEFFLGCPRWLPDNVGCNFVVKLKSAARISSVLDNELGEGIISAAR